MFYYDPKATTFKNINKFSYEFYSDISINMLKYHNDSAAALRVLDAITSASRELMDDLPYTSIFNLRMKNFRQIDRLHKFYLENVPNIDMEKNEESLICYSTLLGYSKFTNDSYQLQHVEEKTEFLRHSYPCDVFFIKNVDVAPPRLVSLPPNVDTDIKLKINNSSITIRPVGPLSENTTLSPEEVVVIIKGINIQGDMVEENIYISMWMDYPTREEWVYIKSMSVINSSVTFDVMLFPYVNGQSVFWDQVYVDREEFDRWESIVTFNKVTRELEFRYINDLAITFPTPTQLFKKVSVFGIPDNDTIGDYFIDQDNGLFYIVTTNGRLYCYPFIIPKATSNILDSKKTLYQSCRIEYFEDSENNKFTFDIFPTAKTNDIDVLDIYVNGEILHEGLVIDLIREKLIDNRVDLMFEDLFADGDECLVEFKTSGVEDSVYPVFLKKPQLLPIFSKNINVPLVYADTPEEYSTPVDSSTSIEYPASVAGSGINTDSVILCKLSRYGGIIVNGKLAQEVFDTFFYNEEDGSIITHDSITGVKVDE